MSIDPGAPPPHVQRIAAQWGVELTERTHTRYSQTWFGVRGSEHVVVKVGGVEARRREAAALRAYAHDQQAPVARNKRLSASGHEAPADGGSESDWAQHRAAAPNNARHRRTHAAPNNAAPNTPRRNTAAPNTPNPEPPIACRVLAEAGEALLLERILLGDDLRPMAATDDDAATATAGAAYARMHQAIAGQNRPRELPELREASAAFTTYWSRPDTGTGSAPPLPRELVVRAQSILTDLTVPDPTDIVLHGDAHHQNLIRHGIGDERDHWRVIDPHGWWGDPTFDAVALMLNLHGSLEMSRRTHQDLRTQAQRRAAILAETAGLDRDRLLAWTFVGAIIAELWCLQDHGFVQGGPLKLAESLRGLA